MFFRVTFLNFLWITCISTCSIGLDAANPDLVKDRIKGSIIGAAVGDALGRVTEFHGTLASIKKNYGPEGIRSFTDFHAQDWVDGKALYTDDTVMAKMLFEELVFICNKDWSSGVFGPYKPANIIMDRFARKCAILFGQEKYTFDPYYDLRAHGNVNIKAGNWLAECLEKDRFRPRYQRTFDYYETGFYESYLLSYPWNIDRVFYPAVAKEGGCGSVMRVYPIGLVFHNNIEFVKKIAEEQSIITHRHPMARAACVAMAVGVAYAINGYTVDKIVDAMIKAAECFDKAEMVYKPHVNKHVNLFSPESVAGDKLLTSDMIRYAYHAAKNGINPEKVLGTHNQKQSNFRSTEGFLLGWAADESVAAAVYVFVRNSNNLHKALIEGVNTPGDSDSIATLAGALVGAYSGLEAFNKSGFDYSRLENLDELLQLADKVQTCKTQNKLPHNNCYWVKESLLGAGEYPGTYDNNNKTRIRLRNYLDSGFTYFVDLTEEFELRPYWEILKEEACLRNINVEHKRFPIKDMSVPTTQFISAILADIDKALQAGHKVYVHCWGGIGRTGTVIGSYFVKHGLSGTQALEKLACLWSGVAKSKIYPVSPCTEEQRQFVRNYFVI